MITWLFTGNIRTLQTFLEPPAPQALRLGNGFATLYWDTVTEVADAGVALVTESGRLALDATTSTGQDGKSVTFTNGSITSTSLLAFSGNVMDAGTAVPFDFVRAASLAGAQKALLSADAPVSVRQARDMTLSGSNIIFGDSDTVIELKEGTHAINVPVIRLGCGRNACILGDRPGEASDGSDVFFHRRTSVVDAGAGRDVFVVNTCWFTGLFRFGALDLNNYNFSQFEEVSLPYGTLLNRAVSTTLSLNLGTKNAFDTFSFGSKACTDYNQNGDMAVTGGTAKNFVISGMAEHSTVNFNGGVAVENTAFIMKGARELDVNFNTGNAVDMTFGTLTLPNTENLALHVSDNNVGNAVSIGNLKITNLRTLTLVDADTNDSAALTVNGTVTGASKADFSGFKGTLTFADNVGFAEIILADAHANTLTLTPDTVNVIEYKAAQGTGDTIANFESATDSIRFPAALSGNIRFVTDTNGTTDVINDATGGVSVAVLPQTNGFSDSNIVFAG